MYQVQVSHMTPHTCSRRLINTTDQQPITSSICSDQLINTHLLTSLRLLVL